MNIIKKVLFVDDDIYFIKLLSLYFKQADFAFSAREARDLIQKKGPFDMVVTDWNMPQEDGLSLAYFIRDRWPQTKIFLLSSEKPENSFEGVYPLSKPISLEHLSSILYGTAKKT